MDKLLEFFQATINDLRDVDIYGVKYRATNDLQAVVDKLDNIHRQLSERNKIDKVLEILDTKGFPFKEVTKTDFEQIDNILNN